jgi:hypothetical protein
VGSCRNGDDNYPGYYTVWSGFRSSKCRELCSAYHWCQAAAHPTSGMGQCTLYVARVRGGPPRDLPSATGPLAGFEKHEKLGCGQSCDSEITKTDADPNVHCYKKSA